MLQAYRDARAYTDGFSLDLPRVVSLTEYILAFYTTPLFKAERLVLTMLVAKPSTDEQARVLAAGDTDAFAAWTVEGRTENQILMCDYQRKTRSWLMCEPHCTGVTRLYFGSAVVPERIHSNGEVYLGVGFHMLLPFHKLYSYALLRSAARRMLIKGGNRGKEG
ncbi:hypothetical protein ABENE_15475 [Asticcacaulis benevestitus DSM 16100 = ATCC BAA-896]|uniref:DUF2867 domain-containing protein n=1 Tax=Asticcacaulis benevestitus DSM 16100 = ATCC BAA-896 TaxID=1121022 RepID=V4PKP8_9CAUL|nr:hypothetical protein ABENE_15475 [Asticcacaulis benevestitus DSM 16100 = ATCC BAA-896]